MDIVNIQKQKEYINNFDMEIVKKITDIRKTKKVSQKKLANFLDVTQGGYARIERGEVRLSVRTMLIACKYLDIDVITLFKNDNQEENKL